VTYSVLNAIQDYDPEEAVRNLNAHLKTLDIFSPSRLFGGDLTSLERV
jgi:hypothetical protein